MFLVTALVIAVVVALGANGTTHRGDWEKILAAVGEDRLLVLVVPHGPMDWIADVQRQMEAQATAHPDRIVLVGDSAGGNLAAAVSLLLRESGTEPVVRVMAEGEDEALVARLVSELCGAIESAAEPVA